MNIFKKKTKPWSDYMSHSRSTDLCEASEAIIERLAFMGITRETLQAIKQSAHLLLPHKADIVSQFYRSITSVPHLRQIIEEHSTVDRLKVTMETYVEQFLQADVHHEYIRTRVVIGHVHSRIHLTAEHFISAHHLLLQIMTSILMEQLHGQPDRMMQAVLAVQKLAAFDQQLIVEVYMEETFKSFLFGVSDMLNHMTQLDTTGQLIKGMEKQIEESHSVSAATEQMSASIQEVADHALTVAEGTDDAVETAERSKQVINKALGDIQQVGRVYDEIMGQVQRLNQEIEHTQEVVQIIKDIADQTNLLALNASIEAARAGEQGRGFAIVASEVRKLAEHTKEQISQITTSIASLQQVSGQVTQQIGDTGKLVEQSAAEAHHADEALQKIVETIQEINQSTTQIAAMTEEQTSSVIDIASRNSVIFDLSTHSQEIARQTAATVLELSKRIDEYRRTFFTINVKLDYKDTIRVAKTDHHLWKWKVYNMLLGLDAMTAEQVSSHEDCRLGLWYYGDLPAQIKSHPAFVQLEAPHKAVHDCARLAAKKYEEGSIAEAYEAFEQLQQQSDRVIALLSQLEAELHLSSRVEK
ncbi:hypothetical protein PAESOLCIP111_02955 [Paenibacillus solanacearum]|uniref:Methyl-accepting transducer domain-containing protein n=1 Tax=Paenibacillus solanacearum TaxID=2048548 RepID=A0A916NJI8_9BACL|nr:methyl-accepting chemotaxis protein [Paenibacillus solanacearum]CAG7627811.1 hypothetical protein PAESOLCIP111_02955 [Paenibacillus solanacearum]